MRPPAPDPGREPDRLSRVFALLLRAYSRRFRRLHGGGMLEAFRVRRVEAERGGRLKLAAWVCLAVADILWNAAQERVSTWRDARRGDSTFAALARNIRFALRQLTRQPALSLTLIVTLGLGTGASATFFGVVDAALLRPLPYPEADRLVLLTQDDPEFGAVPFGPPYLADLRARVATVEPIVGFSPSWEMTLSADVRHHGLDRASDPEIYVPYAQAPVEAMTMVARTMSDPASVTSAARAAIWRVDPNLLLDGAGPVRDLVDGTVQGPRFRAFVLNGFAALALLLAAVGIYGVISYTVAQCTRETGVRVALGADRASLVREIVGRGLASTGWGLLLGLIGGILVSRTLAAFLFGVDPLDPATFAAVAAVIFAVALLASYLPARRAARVDPVRALAAE